MLKSILAEFHHATRPLCVADLQAALALDAGVIDGMIQTLVQRGRLLEIVEPASAPVGRRNCVDAAVCHTCPVRGGCVILTLASPKRYTLAPSDQ